jgi:Holliday junction resolvase RusA-like endonuclease
MYRGNGAKGVYLSGRVENWFDAAAAVIRATPGYRRHLFPKGMPVRVLHALVPPSRQSFDLDNRDKAIYDALQKSGLLYNDSQIADGRRLKFHRQPHGQHAGVYVLVEELPEDFGRVFRLSEVFGERGRP